MVQTEKLLTTVSTKGQVILPKAVRERRDWGVGTRLIVEETPDGVLLKQAPAFTPTLQGSAFGMLAYKGETKALEDMEADILAEADSRYRRSRDPGP